MHLCLTRLLLCAILLATFCFACNRTSLPPDRPTTGAEKALVIAVSDSPATGDSREPELNSTEDGRIILSWVERIGEKRYALRAAMRDTQGWSEARTISAGDNWFINWADFPSVIALRDGSLAAHWLVKSGSGTYAYDVNISLSPDQGKTWTTPIVPHRDNTQTEHGFVSLLSLGDGRLGAVWLDGREMKPTKSEDVHSAAAESMTLRYAAIEPDGKLLDEVLLDERVCECCQTSATMTSEGPIVVYRDRSLEEIRDIAVVRQADGLWTEPKPVHFDNWKIKGCPVNGPSVSAHGRRVAVAWFTGVDDVPHVKVAFSDDAGRTFGEAIVADDGEALGRVDVLMLSEGSALLCWMSGNSEGGALKVRRVRANGLLGPPSIIALTDISRSSGFPRMALLGNYVHFAWTEFGNPSKVRMAFTDVSGFE